MNKKEVSDVKNKYSQHIVIIGAGPAGLSIAEALKEKGYTNVEILEKRTQAGGKAVTKYYKTKDGRNLPYDIGSAQPVAMGTGVFGKIFKKYNAHTGRSVKLGSKIRFMKIKLYSLNEHRAILDYSKPLLGFPLTAKNILYFLIDFFTLSSILIKYRKLRTPNLNNLPQSYYTELGIPYKQFLKQFKFRLLNDERIIRSFGYYLTYGRKDNADENSAFDLIRLFLAFIRFPMRYINGLIKMSTEGYQELWLRVAKNHNVRYGVNIKSVSRLEDRVEIKLENEEMIRCDKLIIACQLPKAKKFLDMSTDEKILSDKFITSPGWRVSFLARNLPTDGAYIFSECTEDPTCPLRVQIIFPEYEVEDNLYLFNTMVNYNRADGIDEVLETAKEYFTSYFGANDIQWLEKIWWPDYNYHLHPDDVKSNLYRDLEKLQNVNNTYFVGECFSEHLHVYAVEYSYDIVKRFF